MTNNTLINTALLAISLFNTIILLWLGLTVALNAERRDWGLWLVSGELILGGIFFFSHTIIIAHGLDDFSRSLDFWWHVGWVPVVTIPYAWYVVMLWYAGFWRASSTRLYRRHWPWFVVSTVLAVLVIVLLFFANPLPSFTQFPQLTFAAAPAFNGIPWLVLIYLFYILLNLLFSLDVLRHPGPPSRLMGESARRRARPWLQAATLTQILVSLLVGWVMLWVVRYLNGQRFTSQTTQVIAAFDLSIATLIALSVIFMGQAVAAYEIFTGKTLPRRALRRDWRRTMILAGGYALLMSAMMALTPQPIYSVLLSALLIVVFFALLSWRSFQEREHYTASLRAFVSGPGVFERLLVQTPQDVDTATPFAALCGEFLNASRVYLDAVGPMAALTPQPLIYPVGVDVGEIPEVEAIFASPELVGVPLERATDSAWAWAVPLWSARGLIGILYLGPRLDGGLYTQEEIDIARTISERLLDTRASAELARRLMALQRQQMAEGQVLDRRTRRALHDDVLPQLHAAMLTLRPDDATLVESLSSLHHQIADLLRKTPALGAPQGVQLGLVAALRQTVDNELGAAFDSVTWQTHPAADVNCRALPPLSAEVIFYAAREAIRNAAQHGRVAARSLDLRIDIQWANGLEIIIADNGAGLGTDAHSSGSGQGLNLHSTMMAVIGGELRTESQPGVFTRITLWLPFGVPR